MSCEVIRVGIFFDGTGNNLFNDENGLSENGVSNVGKLYRLYPNHPTGKQAWICGHKVTECKIHLRSIYIEGVSTTAGESDSSIDAGFGVDGAKRINLAITQIKQIRNEFPITGYKLYIDVFGFSRGAALARDFINTVDKEHQGLQFKLKFVGLFDTVGSFGWAGNDKNYKPVSEKDSELGTIKYEIFGANPDSKKYAPYNFHLSSDSAENIVHFVALDEYRKNFPLTDTEGAGETYYFIGAHSDVGGGYPKKTVENLFEYPNEMAEIERRHPDVIKSKIALEKAWKCQLKQMETPRWNKGKVIKVCEGKRIVTDELQRVSLVAMYNLAAQKDVPFLPFDEEMTSEKMKQMIYAIANSRYRAPRVFHVLNENWSAELQDYYLQAINAETLNDYLAQQTDYLVNGMKEENKDKVKHKRQDFHLKILADYGHNSVCSDEFIGFELPPVGFKHRYDVGIVKGFVHPIAHIATYAGTPRLPIRRIFTNDANKSSAKMNDK